MRHFWPVYATTAVVGTALVWVSAPHARPYVASLRAWVAAAREEAEAGRHKLPEIPPLPPHGTETELVLFPTSALGEPAEARSGSGADAPSPLPSEKGVRLVSRGDLAPKWGLVCRRSDCFMMDGLPTGVLEAGTRFEYQETWHSPSGTMAQIMLGRAEGWMLTTPYLVSPTNLYLFSGSADGLSAEDERALRAHYGLADGGAAGAKTGHPPRGIRLVWRGDAAPAWGIVRQQANRYLPDGTRDGTVAAGTFVDCQKTVGSSKGEVAVCLPETSPGTSSARCLIGVKDLHLFTGSYRDLSGKQRREMQAYYELAGRIALRKSELLQASAAKNPHFAAYQEAYQKLTAHIETSREEVFRRNHAQGVENRVQAQERIAAARIEERRLKLAMEEAQERFTAWRSEHAGELALPERDAEIAEWTRRMRALSPAVAAFGL